MYYINLPIDYSKVLINISPRPFGPQVIYSKYLNWLVYISNANRPLYTSHILYIYNYVDCSFAKFVIAYFFVRHCLIFFSITVKLQRNKFNHNRTKRMIQGDSSVVSTVVKGGIHCNTIVGSNYDPCRVEIQQ